MPAVGNWVMVREEQAINGSLAAGLVNTCAATTVHASAEGLVGATPPVGVVGQVSGRRYRDAMQVTEQLPIRVGRSSRGLSRAVDLVEQNVFVILALVACGMLQTLVVRAAIKPDGWYTLLAGRLIAHSGLPHHDPFTAMADGRLWVDQQ